MPDELVDDIVRLVRIDEYKKDDFILRAGTVSNYTSWILKGLVRTFYEKETEEVTTKFLWEGAPVTSIYSYYRRLPGNEHIVALEDTTLASMHYDDMQYLYKTHPAFNTIGRVVTRKIPLHA